MFELRLCFTARASYLHIITIWPPPRDSNCKHYTNQLMVEPCLYFIACTAILYYYTECHINRKTYIIQPKRVHHILYHWVYGCLRCYNNCKKTLMFNPWLNQVHVLQPTRHVFALPPPGYGCRYSNCKYFINQPIIEAYPCFTAYTPYSVLLLTAIRQL